MEEKKDNRSPKGWDDARVQAVLEHYEAQTEEEAVAEDEAAFGRGGPGCNTYPGKRHGCREPDRTEHVAGEQSEESQN
ncbi:MAG TPA: hypothetical protein VF397_14560 [Pyrinomonadaceae bacterium]